MKKNIVSIIVPMYNVQNYIQKCIESLVEQEYSNIEIILVNDGSPDCSGEIADKFALQDDRILVIHQKNKGVSAARNAGMRVATGEYIMFVDGDDWVDKDYVKYFINLVKKSDCMIGMNKNNHFMSNVISAGEDSIITASKAMKYIYMGDVFVAVWNKIYKRSFLLENKIFFDESIWYGEGMLFNIECLQYVESVSLGEKAVYHQTFNPNSAMRSFNLQSNFCGIRSLEKQRELWKQTTKELEDAWAYHRYCFNRTIIDGLVRSNQLEENKTVYRECKKSIRRGICIPIANEKTVKKKIGWLLYFISPLLMAKRAKRRYQKRVAAASPK